MKVVHKGDPYPQQVAATCHLIMDQLHSSLSSSGFKYMLCWQSKVGPLPWLGPSTGDVLDGLGRQGHKSVLCVPIAFTSDHIETLYEIDIDYRARAGKAGIIHFYRSPSLNDSPVLIEAQAQIVADHLYSDKPHQQPQLHSNQYRFRCIRCHNSTCRTIINPVLASS